MVDSPRSIAICGSGIAAYMTAVALAKSLPSQFQITLIDDQAIDDHDAFYGHVCSPSTYGFHLKIGLTEPDLMMHSDTSFSYGTHYRKWGLQEDLSWVQCFHLALAVQDGVEFHQCLLRAGESQLEPYLVSAQAALKGRFAHPPADPKIPLSRAEYGYQFSTDQYLNVLKTLARHYTENSLKQINAKQVGVVYNEQSIDHLIIDGDKKIHADWFIDCSGPNATLISGLGNSVKATRSVGFLASKVRSNEALSSARTLDSYNFGWQGNTSVRGVVERLSVFDANEPQARQAHGDVQIEGRCSIGRRNDAWQSNCVAIGHAAAIIEPLTPAPMMLLQADIERLLELIPVTKDATIERKEYNRRFKLDYDHANLFNQSMYCHQGLPDTPFWQAATQAPADEKLNIKLTQFMSRGVISMFDLEPFNLQDWQIQHFGMRRCPARYNRFADRFAIADLQKWFTTQANDINNITDKMPPPERYISRMLDYLKSQS